MDFTVGLIAVMGALFAIVLVLIAVSPGTLDGVTEMVRSSSVPKLDRISPQTNTGVMMMEEELELKPQETGMTKPEPMKETPKPVALASTPKSHSISLPVGSGAPGCETTNECYIPSSLSINEGDTVVWINNDTAAHTVTSGTPEDGPDGIFDSSLFMSENTFKVVFEEAGMYDYYCMVHPWMVGQIKVIDNEEMEAQEMMEDEMKESEMIEPEMIAPEMKEPDMMAQPKVAPMTATVSAPEGSGVPGCEKTDECFIPYSVLVAKGGTVTWSNDDTAAHTVTSGTPEDGPDGIFDSSLFMAGNTFDFKFESSGEYDYFCIVHPWMTGTVIVS